ncbi:MAG: ABC transporter permease subunit [Bacillota bacterium]
MRWRTARVVMEKDIREIGTSWQFWLPTIIVPLLMCSILPLAFILIIGSFNMSPGDQEEMIKMIARMPQTLKAPLEGMTLPQMGVHFMLNQFMAPMFLIVPVMVSSVVAASGIAGERERRTIESLFYTPVTDEELYAGKILAAFVPSMVVSAASFLLATLTINLAGYRLFGRVFFPSLTWILVFVLLVPPIAFLALAFTVMVSARAKGFQEAQQMGALLVLPVMLILIGQMTGIFFLDQRTIPILAVVLYILSFVLVRLGAKTINRERIVTQGR